MTDSPTTAQPTAECYSTALGFSVAIPEEHGNRQGQYGNQAARHAHQPDRPAEQSDLVFRLCGRGSAHDGRILRLRSTKCTIGSGRQCTLRLRSPRFRQLHCLIVRGPNATVVRCWAPETLLNGRPFSQSLLTPGDRLGIGPIELEVLQLGCPEPDDCASVARPQQQASPAACDRLLSDQQPRLVSHQRLVTVENQPGTTEASVVSQTADRAGYQEGHQDLSSQEQPAVDGCTDDPLCRPIGSPSDKPADVPSQQHTSSAVQERTDALWRRRTDALRIARRRNRRLIKLVRRLKAQIAEAAKEQLAAGRSAREPEQLPGANRDAECDTEVSEAQCPDDMGHHPSRISAPQGELLRDGSGASSGEAAGDDFPGLPAQPPHQPSAAAPVDLAEVFRRMGVADQLLEGTEPQTADDSVAKGTPSCSAGRRGEQPHSTGPQHGPAEADDGIGAYMEQLLRRLRGPAAESPDAPRRQSPRTVAPPAESPPARTGTSADSEPSVCHQGFVAAASQRLPEPTPAEPVSRALPPEKLTGLSAMRELANISAHAALSQHARRMLARTRRFKLAASLASAFCGIVLLWLWVWYGRPIATAAFGLLSLIAGMVWAFQYAVLTGRLVFDRGGHLTFARKPSRPDARDAGAPAQEAQSAGAEPQLSDDSRRGSPSASGQGAPDP